MPRPPERVVVCDTTALELLLALGLAEQVVGIARVQQPVWPTYATSVGKLRVLPTRGYPNRDMLLALKPDALIAADTEAFEEQAAGSREALAALGIQTFLLSEALLEGDGHKAPITLKTLFADTLTLGAWFNVESRAEHLVAAWQAEATLLAHKVNSIHVHPRVFVFDMGFDRPLTAGGYAIVSDLIQRAGGVNCFAAVRDGYFSTSWEKVIACEPDVILVHDYGKTSLADKIAFLQRMPQLQGLRAVREQRYVALPLDSTLEGIRNCWTAHTLFKALHGERHEKSPMP